MTPAVAAAGGVGDVVWSAQGTTPDAIEAALRRLLAQRHAENPSLAPARLAPALGRFAHPDAGTR